MIIIIIIIPASADLGDNGLVAGVVDWGTYSIRLVHCRC